MPLLLASINNGLRHACDATCLERRSPEGVAPQGAEACKVQRVCLHVHMDCETVLLLVDRSVFRRLGWSSVRARPHRRTIMIAHTHTHTHGPMRSGLLQPTQDWTPACYLPSHQKEDEDAGAPRGLMTRSIDRTRTHAFARMLVCAGNLRRAGMRRIRRYLCLPPFFP